MSNQIEIKVINHPQSVKQMAEFNPSLLQQQDVVESTLTPQNIETLLDNIRIKYDGTTTPWSNSMDLYSVTPHHDGYSVQLRGKGTILNEDGFIVTIDHLAQQAISSTQKFAAATKSGVNTNDFVSRMGIWYGVNFGGDPFLFHPECLSSDGRIALIKAAKRFEGLGKISVDGFGVHWIDPCLGSIVVGDKEANDLRWEGVYLTDRTTRATTHATIPNDVFSFYSAASTFVTPITLLSETFKILMHGENIQKRENIQKGSNSYIEGKGGRIFILNNSPFEEDKHSFNTGLIVDPTAIGAGVFETDTKTTQPYRLVGIISTGHEIYRSYTTAPHWYSPVTPAYRVTSQILTNLAKNIPTGK